MIGREHLEDLVYGGRGARRHTQDSPVAPDVWLAYYDAPAEPQDLLLAPHGTATSAALSVALRDRLQAARTAGHAVAIAHTASHVAARLSFDELLWAALPLSAWWGTQETWLAELAGLIALREQGASLQEPPPGPARGRALDGLLAGRAPEEGGDLLWSVSLNRPATPAVHESRRAVKADAAQRVFALSCAELGWAVLDSGIDARHPAFRLRRPDGRPREGELDTRVEATYDFRRLRDVQAAALEPRPAGSAATVPDSELERTLAAGRLVDWELLLGHLRVPHDGGYVAPSYPHGTHVAGILAGDWRAGEPGLEGKAHDVQGMCPDLRLYDLRVLDDGGAGAEFSVLAALQFVRDLNARGDRMLIHGVNVSLSLQHDFRTRACGHTAVCREAEALVASGVVVVAAAGNQGMATFDTRDGRVEGFRTVSITDPGNAEEVITVGSTHRSRPHQYGVSYFSSRGPTGDGRAKPDLVAPGEKIRAPFPDGALGTQDGTSMAAPHVSGAAALLLASHRELVGRPRTVKRVLCETATDLGREPAFQGAGMLDVLRAAQAV